MSLYMVGRSLYRAAHFCYWRAKGIEQQIPREWLKATPRLIKSEIAGWDHWIDMPLRRRLWLWRHGFHSVSNAIYDFESYGTDMYLSDAQRARAEYLNGKWRQTLRNKLFFHWMMSAFPDHRPPVYGLLKQGRFHEIGALEADTIGQSSIMPETPTAMSDRTKDPVAEIDKLLNNGALVLKPSHGAIGRDVRIVRKEGTAYEVNGAVLTDDSFEELIRGLEDTLVCRYIDQAAYADELYPNATNTIRILTMWDDDVNEAYLPIAVHRIGAEYSAPLDNWSQGGLSAEIELETGTLGKGVQHPKAGGLQWYESHPDTDAEIEGRQVPAWQTVRNRVLDMAAKFSHISYIGWDVLITDTGEFVILEGNANSDVDLLQVHKPLLTDNRARDFYERYGVL